MALFYSIPMLSTLIITLREGLEAALIVGILIAYARKSGRDALIAPIWWGVASAIALSAGLGAFLTITSTKLSDKAEKLFAGTTSIVAVALVTWMIFWMKKTARNLRNELTGKMEKAAVGGSLAIAGAAFLATAREGLETALFIYTNAGATGAGRGITFGLIIGFAIAIALGVGIYKRSISLNLSTFFTYTGAALVVIAAGVLANGIYEFQEIGWLPGLGAIAVNLSSVLTEGDFLEAALHGTFGLNVETTWLQLGSWALYIATVLYFYLPRSVSKTPSAPLAAAK